MMNAHILLNYGERASAIMIYEEKSASSFVNGEGDGAWALDLRADPWPAHRIETQYSSQPLRFHGHGPFRCERFDALHRCWLCPLMRLYGNKKKKIVNCIGVRLYSHHL